MSGEPVVPDRAPRHPAAWTPAAIAAALAVIALGALALSRMGRRWWCATGSLSPWSWDIWSHHNSQHLLDPYTFTHVLHGTLAHALLWLAVGTRGAAPRAVLAVTAEVLWEVVENTDRVIQAYRESTIALHYEGDSILNSLADVAAFAAGYAVARRLPVWLSAAGFLVVEAALLLTVRDSLLLNVLMLVHPVAALKRWQTGS